MRGVIACVECGKARCVFSAESFTKTSHRDFMRVKDELMYTCGSKLFPDGHEQEKKVVVRQAQTCTSLIETLYYSGVLKRLTN